MTNLTAFNLKNWIDDHRNLLKPPVGNKMVWEDSDFIVMVVGGPNAREDFHTNRGDEFFYQIEGDIHLEIKNQKGQFEKVSIRAGDIFLLPAGVPHSPQRPAGSVGLVVERKRRQDELDKLTWYCRQCRHELYEVEFHLYNIETQFKGVFATYYGNEANYTCTKCGHINAKR